MQESYHKMTVILGRRGAFLGRRGAFLGRRGAFLGREELSSDGKFTNVPKSADISVKRPRLDLSLSRQPWVEGCSAALPRADIQPHRGGGPSARGHQPRGGSGQRGRGYQHQWRMEQQEHKKLEEPLLQRQRQTELIIDSLPR
jgi:hypothetical protein